MAVDDLWIRKRTKERTPLWGKVMRYRVRVPGYPAESYRTKDAAERREAQLRTERPVLRPAQTVGEALDLWLAGKRGLTPAGYAAARNAAAHVSQRWAAEQVGDVRTPDVQAWLADYPIGIASKRKIVQALGGAMRVAVQSGAIATNPVDAVTLPKATKTDPRFLTIGQVRTIAAECGRGEPMVIFLATTGLRISECLRLNVGDVDVTRARVHVSKAKNGEPRDVPVPAKVLAMLDLDRPAAAPLFTSSVGNRLDRNRWSARVWYPARERAGYPDVRLHDLRHTAASLMIASGATVKDVQRALGHRSAAVTLDVYAGHWDASLDDIARRLDAKL